MLVPNALITAAVVPLALQGEPTGKLLKDDVAYRNRFGESVRMSGTLAVLGAGRDDDLGDNAGAAYVFDTVSGEQVRKLFGNDTSAGDGFGDSVGIDGNTLIVGSPGDDGNGSGSGSAYLLDVVTGRQIAKLLPADGSTADLFGWSAAIGGGTAIVGAPYEDEAGPSAGAAYLFDTTTGAQLAKLVASDGAAFDYFGTSVGIGNGIAVVGASSDDDHGPFSGSAYLFDAATGAQIAKLHADDAAADDRFGGAVAIRGTVVAIGAHGDDDNGEDSGSVYVFDAATVSQVAKLLALDGAAGDYLGISVALDGTTVVAGAWGDDDHGDRSGSAYVFDATTRVQIAKLVAGDAWDGDLFGYSVAIAGTSVLVGNPGQFVGLDRGAAYGFCLDCQGASYCLANPTSRGAPARMCSCGSTSIAANRLRISAAPVPLQTYLFFHSDTRIQVPFGDGFLCIGGSITRLNPPELVRGYVAGRKVDLPSIAVPGTYYFQCWFRDVDAGGAGFNLSDGLEVTLVP